MRLYSPCVFCRRLQEVVELAPPKCDFLDVAEVQRLAAQAEARLSALQRSRCSMLTSGMPFLLQPTLIQALQTAYPYPLLSSSSLSPTVNQLEQAEEWIEDGEQAVARGDFETAKSLFVEACDTYMELVR